MKCVTTRRVNSKGSRAFRCTCARRCRLIAHARNSRFILPSTTSVSMLSNAVRATLARVAAAKFFSLIAIASGAHAQTSLEVIQLDPTETGRFGTDGIAVGISGNRVICSSWGRLDWSSGLQGGVSPGRAFVLDANTGQGVLELVPTNGQQHDHFGVSMAVDGERVLIGSLYGDGVVPDSGSAYVFDLQTGQELIRLQAMNGSPFDLFGASVDLDGDLAIVGASYFGFDRSAGTAHLFDVNTGLELHRLVPPGPNSDREFGMSVAIGSGFALVGADRQDPLGPSVRVFDSSTGQLLRTLLPDVPSPPSELFGVSLALVETTAIVGAPRSGALSNASGSVYMFDVTTGQQIAQLKPGPHSLESAFGWNVAGGDNRVLTASITSWPGPGHAYVFDLSTAQLLKKLTVGDTSTPFGFGSSLAYDSGRFVVGNPLANGNGVQAGGVYVFDDVVPNSGQPYCFGDGTGASCPCGNYGGLGQGCAVPGASGLGAKLDGVGSAQVGNSSLILRAVGVPSGSTGLFFQGGTQQALPLGEGILCTAARLRFPVQTTGNGLVMMEGADAFASPGATVNYQFWFRNPISACGLGGHNFTNAWSVTW